MVLVEMLSDGTPRGKRDAVSALFNLCINRSNTARVVEVGAVPLLVNLLTEEDHERPGLADDALAVLAILYGQCPGLAAVSQTLEIPIFVALLQRVKKTSWRFCCRSVVMETNFHRYSHGYQILPIQVTYS